MYSMQHIVPDDYVVWKWGSGIAYGLVIDVIPDRTEIVVNGKQIHYNGTLDNPAVVIRRLRDGQTTIKPMDKLTLTRSVPED